MADIRITSPGGQTLYYTLAQFTANASVVYPANTIIWLKDTDGYCKIADGVTTLGNLPFKQVTDIVNPYKLSNDIFQPIVNGSIYEEIVSLGGGNLLSTIYSSNANSGVVIKINKRINLQAIGLIFISVPNPTNIKLALYEWDIQNEQTGSKLTSDLVMSLSAGQTGRNYVNLPSPLDLMPGYYMVIHNTNSNVHLMYHNIAKYATFNNLVIFRPVYSYYSGANYTNPLPTNPVKLNFTGVSIDVILFKYTLNI
jgi:hypothetical protein